MVVNSQSEKVAADYGYTDPDNLARPNESYRTVRLEDPHISAKRIEMYLVLHPDELLAVLGDPQGCPAGNGFRVPYAKNFQEELKGKLERDAGVL